MKSLVRLCEKDCAFFDERILFEDYPERSTSIKALMPCMVAIIERTSLISILKDKPEIGTISYRNMATVLTHRLIKANRDMLKLTTAFSLALEGN
jgi:hypothetical protein